jgi:carbohydrate-binding DOMON domain-containing protein
MKKNFLVLFAVVISIFNLGCGGKKQTTKAGGFIAPTKSNVVFSYQDSQFDDRGTGRVIYPTNLQGVKEGIFDMSAFIVKDIGDVIEFEIKFRRPIDRDTVDFQSFAKGWAYQMVDIYIDTNHIQGSGQTYSLPGRNIEFNKEEAWDKVVVVTPGSSREVINYFKERSELRQFHPVREDIIVPYDAYAKSYSLVARVQKSELGQPNPNWGYQVCVMGFDPENRKLNGLHNREVMTFADDMRFGGGSDYSGDPNVIDILSPDKRSQYQVLSGYRSNPSQNQDLLAIIPMLYQKSKQKMPKIRQKSMKQQYEVQNEPINIEQRYRAPVKVKR